MEVSYDGFFTAMIGGTVNYPAVIILDQPKSITERQNYITGSTTNTTFLQGNAGGGFLTPGLPYPQG